MIYYCQLHKKFDADGIHNVPNKLIRYYCITLFLIKVNDTIEILKYVYMGILILIPYCYLSLKSIWYCLLKQMELNCIKYTCLKRDVYDVMHMLCTHVMMIAYS